MSPHVSELLAAYHDGELSLKRQQQVESHLQDCPACRAELEELEGLTSALKAYIVPDSTPPERFAAQVQLRLPHATLAPARSKGELPAHWALGVPLALIIAWTALQAALWVISATLSVDNLTGQRAAFFNSWIPAGELLSINGNLLVINIILFAGTTILWSAWMALWLVWKEKEE